LTGATENAGLENVAVAPDSRGGKRGSK